MVFPFQRNDTSFASCLLEPGRYKTGMTRFTENAHLHLSTTRYVLDEHEHLLSLKVVMLTDNYNQLSRRAKPYLVIGTASLEGEDTQCKGRVG